MRLRTGALIACVGAVGALAFSQDPCMRRSRRQIARGISRRSHHERDRLQGTWYRVRGRHPDENVSDLVLADRVRSTLGPLERQLDLPHIHIMVNRHVAMLHGEVGDQHQKGVIERAVAEIYGVKGVDSHLRVGLLRSDTRPSAARAHPQHSTARRRLESAAIGAGAPTGSAQAVRAVLSALCERLPTDERDHVLAHLPEDVQSLARPVGDGVSRIRTVDELLATVAALDPDLDASTAERITEAVFAELRSLIPEERADVAAVLPRMVRELWDQASSATSDERRSDRRATPG